MAIDRRNRGSRANCAPVGPPEMLVLMNKLRTSIDDKSACYLTVPARRVMLAPWIERSLTT